MPRLWQAGRRRRPWRGSSLNRAATSGLFAFVLASCAPSPAPALTVTLSGSSTIAPLAVELARNFEKSHPGVRVDVEAGGSARGVTDVRAGRVVVGMVSRALKNDENDLTAHLLAVDGVAMIVRRDATLDGLTTAQVKAIYTGRVKAWRELGVGGGSIVVVHKAAGRSTHELFLAHFALAAQDIRASVVIGDNLQGIKSVAAMPDAIGYVSIGAATSAIESGVPIRLLALDGVQPTFDRVRDGTWPLRRELNLVTLGEPTGVARDFLSYSRSAGAHATIERLSFVPVR